MEVGPGDCRRGGSRVGFLRKHGPFSLTQENRSRARYFSPKSAAGTALLFSRFLCGPRAWSPYENWGGSFQPRSWLPVQQEQDYTYSSNTQHTRSRVIKCFHWSRSDHQIPCQNKHYAYSDMWKGAGTARFNWCRRINTQTSFNTRKRHKTWHNKCFLLAAELIPNSSKITQIRLLPGLMYMSSMLEFTVWKKS